MVDRPDRWIVKDDEGLYLSFFRLEDGWTSTSWSQHQRNAHRFDDFDDADIAAAMVGGMVKKLVPKR